MSWKRLFWSHCYYDDCHLDGEGFYNELDKLCFKKFKENEEIELNQ